jgi:hypothetical protein
MRAIAVVVLFVVAEVLAALPASAASAYLPGAHNPLTGAPVAFVGTVDRQPDSTTTARKLADACAQSGQGGYANQVRLRYGLEQADKRPGSRG